ncbi:MAG: hypothetical protein ACI4DK_02905 [Lachnospiraceae bacterium]
MRMRYYLRGLGIGIVVTALLMGFTKGGQKETLTDAEIVERAKSLGMLESSVLSADLGNKEEISVNDISEVAQQEAQQTEPEAETDNPTQTDSEKETETNSSTQIDSEKEIETDNPEKTDLENKIETDNPAKTKSDAETVKSDQADSAEKRYVVTIYSGDGSRTVANRLEEMGVIEDAAEFDRYLCQNGYDKRLTTGNHEINAGADEKEIAEALVKRVN